MCVESVDNDEHTLRGSFRAPRSDEDLNATHALYCFLLPPTDLFPNVPENVSAAAEKEPTGTTGNQPSQAS
jgi:hypothetical protein